MGNDHKSFLLYLDQKFLFDKLSPPQAGVLIKTIFEYCNNGRISNKISDPLIDIAFESIRISLDRNNLSWEKSREARRNNGKKGGRPKLKL